MLKETGIAVELYNRSLSNAQLEALAAGGLTAFTQGRGNGTIFVRNDSWNGLSSEQYDVLRHQHIACFTRPRGMYRMTGTELRAEGGK